MKTNMGLADRLIRIAIAVAIIILFVNGQIDGVYTSIGLVFSGILILTSFISFCPLYWPFRINTKKKVNSTSK